MTVFSEEVRDAVVGRDGAGRQDAGHGERALSEREQVARDDQAVGRTEGLVSHLPCLSP